MERVYLPKLHIFANVIDTLPGGELLLVLDSGKSAIAQRSDVRDVAHSGR